MTVDIGIAKVQTLGLSDSTPTALGKAQAGTGVNASRDDHVHPLLIPIGVYVGSDGYPQLETTSTLCFISIPSGVYLGWDNGNQLFVYG